MNISKRKQGILAIICTIAMIVTSITVYNPREVKADPSATVEGKQYSATVKDRGEWAWFDCQGIFDSARIHFAWGIDVDLNTITASIGETKLKVDGKSARGMYIPLSEVTSLEAGSYDIVINATTVASESAEAKEISATATLKIEVPEETTTTTDPSVVVWKNIVGGTGYSYNDNTTVQVVSVQQPEFASEQGIYMTVTGTIESISINGVDSEKYALQGGGAVVYLSGLVKGENTINIKYAGGEATVIIKNENEQLKQQLNLAEKYGEYTTVPGTIISRDISNYSKTLVINIGSDNGVKENMTVIADEGLVGYIVSTTAKTAKIQTIVDSASSTSCLASTTRDVMTCKGTIESESTLKATNLKIGSNVIQGDSVETSGMGGIYTKGIHVGRIKKVETGTNKIDSYAVIETAVDFNKLETVLVIIK